MSRTVIVGDVHGCRDELESLLDRIAFTAGDRLVFVGDLIARGPDTLGVLDVARRTGAVIVRGNHEEKLLQWRAARREWMHGRDRAVVPLGRVHREVAHALRPVDWTLLATAPLSVELPEHGIRVVHAGVQPGVPFPMQSPETLLHIRTVARGRGKRDRVLWGARYAGPPHIVFGHNAAPGLQLHARPVAHATGLDTGCVYGGALTAVVLAENQRMPRTVSLRRALLVQQPARRVYFDAQERKRVA
jgi:hypothetical protein